MLGENTAWSDKTSAPLGRTPAILCDRFVLEERLEHGRIGTMYRALDRLRAVHRSEEHTSELQSRENLVCRLLLEKKNSKDQTDCPSSIVYTNQYTRALRRV